jgi:hypothetical protein
MRRALIFAVLSFSLALANTPAVRASVVGDAIVRDADKIVTNQTANGSWSGLDNSFTGAITAGLIDAYNTTGNAAYKAAAQNGAGFSMGFSSLLGDETYALTRVASVQPNPNSNPYLTTVQNYFSTVHSQAGGTQGVIDSIISHYTTTANDQSQAVIYLAYYTVAANTVNAGDKTIWRNGLLNALGQVDDNDSFPVGSLGEAVWALAQTGNGLSASTVLSGPSTVLNNKTLADLPALLAGQIEPSGLKAGTFYWDFDHTDGGYTEDTSMGILGLAAANAINPALNYGSLITTGQSALASSIDNSGNTYLDVTHSAPVLNVYGGRALGAMTVAVPEPSSALVLSIVTLSMIGRRRLRRQH